MKVSDPFEALQNQIRACRICRERFGYEPHPVVFGSRTAPVMQISQAPSRNVHQTLRPFDDASGRKLRRDWYRIADEIFYDPACFLITSTAKCYPGKSPGKGDRRPPAVCAETWLMREVELAENQIYILIGRYVADFFFPGQDFSALVMEDQELLGKKAYVLPHPSPLNLKWLKDHPDFEARRMPEIASVLHSVLGIRGE